MSPSSSMTERLRGLPLEDATSDVGAHRHEAQHDGVARILRESCLGEPFDARDVPVPKRKVARVRDHVPHTIGRRVELHLGLDDGQGRATVALSHPRHQTVRSGRSRTSTDDSSLGSGSGSLEGTVARIRARAEPVPEESSASS